MTLIADDLFAGAGGWDLNAAQLGIHARGVENMKEALATREAAGLTTIHDDVWTFEPDGKATGLIASPPCQTFSTAGKGSGRKALDQVLSLVNSLDIYRMHRLQARSAELGDDRTGLVLSPLHFALTNPSYRWLAWEQVPTVLPVWEACAERLRTQGWSVWTGILNAEQYGVPQTRRRAFLLASRDYEVAPPTPTHSRYYSRNPDKLDKGVEKWVSMAEALGWGLQERPSPTVTGGGTETGGAEPIAHLARWTERPDWLESNYSGPTNDAGKRDLAVRSLDAPAPTITSKSHKWVFRANALAHAAIRPASHPAPTITAGHSTGERKWYPPEADTKDRSKGIRVTVNEAGVLQTFPSNFPWQGGIGRQYLQAGNAVPPRLAMAGLAAVTQLEEKVEVAS